MSHNPGFLKLIEEARPSIKEVSVQEVAKKIESGAKFILVDTREDLEWETGHAKDAIHLSKGVIERDIEATIPDKNAEIILYCRSGFRSILSAESLGKMGYTNVASMKQGITGWIDNDLPTVVG